MSLKSCQVQRSSVFIFRGVMLPSHHVRQLQMTNNLSTSSETCFHSNAFYQLAVNEIGFWMAANMYWRNVGAKHRRRTRRRRSRGLKGFCRHFNWFILRQISFFRINELMRGWKCHLLKIKTMKEENFVFDCQRVKGAVRKWCNAGRGLGGEKEK